MWYTKYASVAPKNLEVGVNSQTCNEGYFWAAFVVCVSTNQSTAPQFQIICSLVSKTKDDSFIFLN